MIVQKCVLAYIGAKEASKGGKGKGEGFWRAEKEYRKKCEARSGVTGDGMGQEEAGPLTMQKAVFRHHGLTELPLI